MGSMSKCFNTKFTINSAISITIKIGKVTIQKIEQGIIHQFSLIRIQLSKLQ